MMVARCPLGRLVFLPMLFLCGAALAQEPTRLYPRPASPQPAQTPAQPPSTALEPAPAPRATAAPQMEPAVPPAPAPGPAPEAPRQITPPAPAPAAALPTVPSAAPPPAPAPAQPSAQPSAEAAVRGFYAALGQADGERANAYVIPEKRNSGAYEIASMNRFYGAMREPLQLLGVGRLDDHLIRVRYAYEHRSGRRCNGAADVTLRDVRGTYLIERIRDLGGC